MDRYVIKGGYALKGTLTVQGAKNSILPILAASLLNSSSEPIRLQKVPDLFDVRAMLTILSHLGVNVAWEGNDILLETYQANRYHVPEYLMREMRSSIFLLGPLLARYGKARLCYPGGCAIGERPIDLHLKGLQKMGAVVEENNSYINAQGRLRGIEMRLDLPSVGATENLMMAGVLARGETIIHNAAKEPEIVDLQNFLNTIGAKVSGAGSSSIVVEGVSGIKGGQYRIFPDRIAAGTYIIAAIVTGGQLTLKEIIPEHLEPLLQVLRQAEAEIEVGPDWVTVKKGNPRAVPLIEIEPHPGFPTDLQPQLLAMLALLRGKSVVTDHVFPKRFHHVAELNRMGAMICLQHNRVEIRGTSRLNGAQITASDLRAGAALVIAGLAARGETVVTGVRHINRGYENLAQVFNDLGARIENTVEPVLV